jgi:hypothetical protein
MKRKPGRTFIKTPMAQIFGTLEDSALQPKSLDARVGLTSSRASRA